VLQHPCTKKEFFFRIPFTVRAQLRLFAEQGTPVTTTAQALRRFEPELERGPADSHAKRRTTEYLRMPPLDLSTT
jgi:NAD+ synthase